MRIFIFFYFLLNLSIARSETSFIDQIHDIDIGQKNEDTLILLKSGKVLRLIPKDENVRFFKEDLSQNKWFVFKVTNRNYIVDINKLDLPQEKLLPLKITRRNPPFIPSIINGLDNAKEYFSASRFRTEENSQCYNRAHAWAFDWRVKKSFYSSKVWLFFTKKYIRQYEFEWWFHVAPMIYVAINGEVKERMMDMKYASAPLKIKDWTSIFMRDNAGCPVVEKYSDHADFPESGSCFLMKSSMYYYQPIDLEQLETNQTERSVWIKSEVNQAFKDAFNEVL